MKRLLLHPLTAAIGLLALATLNALQEYRDGDLAGAMLAGALFGLLLANALTITIADRRRR